MNWDHEPGITKESKTPWDNHDTFSNSETTAKRIPETLQVS